MNAWGYGAENWLDTQYTQVTLDVILASWRLLMALNHHGTLYGYSCISRRDGCTHTVLVCANPTYGTATVSQKPYSIRLTTGIKGDVHTSMQCIRPENPPNRTNTDNMDRCTHIDGTARPVKVGGKSTTPHPGKTGVKNLGTQHCGTHEDGKIWMALEESGC
ncbi:hypothetical protein C8F01DRAFT_1274451 [Mycena amicta]|nr:hypothetical protein C8F01DRAFT_1274451 [Mycena amicta]